MIKMAGIPFGRGRGAHTVGGGQVAPNGPQWEASLCCPVIEPFWAAVLPKVKE